jgi:Ca2+-binding RTX toxin-like protein
MFKNIKNNRVRKSVGFKNKSQAKASRRVVLNWECGLETRELMAGRLIAYVVAGLNGGDYSPQVLDKLFELGFEINPGTLSNTLVDYVSNWNSINRSGDPGNTNLALPMIKIGGQSIELPNPPGGGFSVPEFSIPDPLMPVKFDVNIGSPNTNDGFVNPALSVLNSYDDQDTIVLIGHSLGGDAVLELARKANVQIDLLALIDPVGFIDTSSLPQGGIVLPGAAISFSNGISNADGQTPGFRSGLPDVPSNVKYFYNRWQTNAIFPMDIMDSGYLTSYATRSIDTDYRGLGPGGRGIAGQSSLNSRDRYMPNLGGSPLDGLAYLIGSVDLNPLTERDVVIVPATLLTPEVKISVPALNSDFNTTTVQLHHDMPRNNQIEDDLKALISGLVPQPPTAQAGIANPLPNYYEGDLIQLSSSGTTDPNPGDKDQLTYKWEVYDGMMSGIAGGTPILLVNSPNPVFIPKDNGRYTIVLTVTDPTGLSSDEASFQLDVQNVAPSMSEIAGPIDWVRTIKATYDVSFTDPGAADTFQIQWNYGDGIYTPWLNAFVTPPFALTGVPNTTVHRFLNTGVFTVSASVRDDDGGSDSKSITVKVKTAGLISDPYSSGKTALAVGGTGGKNKIILTQNDSPGFIDVYVDGSFEGSFAPTGHVIVDGGAGDDIINMDPKIQSPAVINGGDGNDIISSTGSLFGDAGNDTFIVPVGTNSIDGGVGVDSILVEGTDIKDFLSINQTAPLTPSLETNVVITTQSGSDPSQSSTNTVQNVEILNIQGLNGDDFLAFSGTGQIPINAFGGFGNDFITGSPNLKIPASAVISAYGEQGDDMIQGGVNNDSLFGGQDSDSFFGSAGGGNDTIDGGTGRDALIYSGSTTLPNCLKVASDNTFVTQAMINLTLPADLTLSGSVLAADLEHVSLVGGTGQDEFHVADLTTTGIVAVDIDTGSDTISDLIEINGSNSADNIGASISATNALIDVNGLATLVRVYGVTMADYLYLNGNAGNDTILVEADPLTKINVQVSGGSGDDFIRSSGVIGGGSGNDTIYGSGLADLIAGEGGDDLIYGLSGDDRIYGDGVVIGIGGGFAVCGVTPPESAAAGGIGNDTIDGGDGNDVIQGNAGDDSILGGLGLDSIHGGLGADFISGDAGNDSLCGGPDDSENVDPALDGSDTIFGGSGNDAINGDAGDDFLNGGFGNDQLWGNDGNDTIGVFVYNGVTQFEPGNDSMIGGLGDDLIAGALVDSAGKPVNDGNDVMFGQEGNDTIWGGAGGDMIYGGDGNDVMLGGIPLTANTLHAPRNGKLPNDGNDTMFGGNGFDKVDGGNNNNLLDAGNDGIRETVLGGKGNDMGYNHTLQDSVNFDVLALDGGFNHKFCDGGLEEPPVPTASCTYIAWAIPSNYFTGVKTLKNDDIVEHPSMDYRTKPNNGPNGPVIKSVKIESSKAAVSKTTLVKSAVSKSSTSFSGKSKTVGKLSSGLGKLQVAKG